MSVEPGYLCSSCGTRHDGPPFAYGTLAPAHWHDGLAAEPHSQLADEQCVIGGESFFVRARVVLPLVDDEREFEWGVWVSLAEANFQRMGEVWDDPGRADEPPCFGWLATELPYDPTTLNLKTMVHTRPVGQRPVVELEPTEHPLAVEQRSGITLARVRELAERVLHPS